MDFAVAISVADSSTDETGCNALSFGEDDDALPMCAWSVMHASLAR